MEFMRINVLGPALVFQAFVAALDRSKRPEGPVVLNTTSGLGSIGLDLGVKNASYSISKCALQMLVSKLPFYRGAMLLMSPLFRLTNSPKRSLILSAS